jgi:hypothetical protein
LPKYSVESIEEAIEQVDQMVGFAMQLRDKVFKWTESDEEEYYDHTRALKSFLDYCESTFPGFLEKYQENHPERWSAEDDLGGDVEW